MQQSNTIGIQQWDQWSVLQNN